MLNKGTCCYFAFATFSLFVLAAGRDFLAPMSTTLTFTPANSPEPRCVTISIEDDHALEDTESFSVHLATSDDDVKLQYNYSTITILDNDGMPWAKRVLIGVHVPITRRSIKRYLIC